MWQVHACPAVSKAVAFVKHWAKCKCSSSASATVTMLTSSLLLFRCSRRQRPTRSGSGQTHCSAFTRCTIWQSWCAAQTAGLPSCRPASLGPFVMTAWAPMLPSYLRCPQNDNCKMEHALTAAEQAEPSHSLPILPCKLALSVLITDGQRSTSCKHQGHDHS